MKKSDLIILSSDEQVDLILWQFKEIERLKKEVESLQKELSLPQKNSKNSSVPPSKSFKSNKKGEISSSSNNDKNPKHTDGGRELSSNPDKTFDFKSSKCLDCNNEELVSKLVTSYDKIFLPEVKVKTVRVNVYECLCKNCNKVVKTEIPDVLSSRELLSDNLKAMIKPQ